jgi:hypothetical protein
MIDIMIDHTATMDVQLKYLFYVAWLVGLIKHRSLSDMKNV